MQRGHVGRPRMESLILGADVVEMKQLRLGDCIFGRSRPGGNVMQMLWRVNCSRSYWVGNEVYMISDSALIGAKAIVLLVGLSPGRLFHHPGHFAPTLLQSAS